VPEVTPTMHALRAHRRGGPEVLVYEPAPRPEPAAGELVVAVFAAGITFAELGWEETWTRGGVDRTPTTPSHEFSGVVTHLGPEVQGWAPGDEVFGMVPFDRDGAAADFVAVPATSVARLPRSVPHTVGAALPLAGLTAWQALVDHAEVKPGDEVLVHGAAGGVGSFVTQLAVALGARVTGTALAADAAHVRELGAQRVVAVESEAFDARVEAFDVVVDTVGGATLDRSFAVLRRGGRLVTLQAPPSQETAARFGVTADFFIVSADATGLARLAQLVDAGELRVPIAATFPLADGAAAFASGATLARPPGKTVLLVRTDEG
jgi:NADPH:quinone reductase-like Zn-dependent oxidoreductase